MARKIEIATGVINGANTIFTTSVPYQPGSLSVWRNGQEILCAFVETDPALGIFTITDPDQIPIAWAVGEDKIVAEFWDGVDEIEIIVVDEISATVEDAPFGITCQVEDLTQIACTIEDQPIGLDVTVEDVSMVACELSDIPQGISCQVEDC